MTQLSSTPKYILVGPTAAGKSDVAHEIAHRTGWGIISADAMMVYKDMRIGTAKPAVAERGYIPYAGIDITTPDTTFSVHDYLMTVNRQISAMHHVTQWMVVGGTGLYVRCLIKGLDEQGGADEELRKIAESVLHSSGFDALKKWCIERVPHLENTLPTGDIGNPRRWIRAVERRVTEPFAGKPAIPDDISIVGLKWSREILEQRMISRVKKMYADGLLDEVAYLKKQYETLSSTAMKAIGYAEAIAVLEGKINVNEAREKTVIRTRQYAKRQMTWFRHQLPTRWIDMTGVESLDDVALQVQKLWEPDE